MKINFKSRGFTLIELLVVVSIIVILTGIILKNLSGSRAKARDAQRISDLGQIQLALALFVDRCGEYPTQGTLNNSQTNPKCPSGVNLGTYINMLSLKPPAGAGQADYDYAVYRPYPSGARINYMLHAKLESTNVATAKGLCGTAAVSAGKCTLSVFDPASALIPVLNYPPYGWGQAGDGLPYNNCDNSPTSLDYCIGPN